jgi:hypothetical protein
LRAVPPTAAQAMTPRDVLAEPSGNSRGLNDAKITVVTV